MTIPNKWHKEVDVVCVGYGAAGASAAITAYDNKASVLIIEKMPESGGNTRFSTGGFICPTDVNEAITYIKGLFQLSKSEMDEDLVRVYAEESIKNVDWLKGLKEGTEVMVYGHAGYPNVPGAKSMVKYGAKGNAKGPAGRARNLWDIFMYAVEEKRKIPVMLNTPAKRLVRNCDGEIIGVVAESNGKEFNALARKAVILTTGGYEYDEKVLQNFIKGYPIYAVGNPGNTGDGVRMASAVGAGLWHMNGASCPLGIKVPDYEGAFPLVIGTPGFIYVDKHGKRFVNERSIELHAGLLAVDYFDNHSLEYPRIPCYLIFDETNRLKGPVSAWAGVGYTAQRFYKWSKDNSAEIDKGWIVKAGTPVELAGKIGIDPANLEATLLKWNEDIKSGKGDTVYGRRMRYLPESNPAYNDLQTPLWSAPIDKPPFYAVQLYPCLLNTQGGPRRNTNAQIVDPFGQAIPRLYSSGELGSMWGLIYQGAGNIAECMIFGRIAGRQAAALKPWEK